MEKLLSEAHARLDEEVRRLSATYQHTILEAGIAYQRGLHAAQTEFEERLRQAASAMTATVQGAFNQSRGST